MAEAAGPSGESMAEAAGPSGESMAGAVVDAWVELLQS